jgi:hypothetical protein
MTHLDSPFVFFESFVDTFFIIGITAFMSVSQRTI